MWKASVASIALVLSLGVAEPAKASSEVVIPVIEQVRSDGFVVASMRKHWTGRMIIVSYNTDYVRETVINGKTGAIIRDELKPRDRVTETTYATASGSASGNGNSQRNTSSRGSSRSGAGGSNGGGSGGSGSNGGGSGGGGSNGGGSGGIGVDAEASVDGGGISAGVGASVGGLGVGVGIGIGKN